MGKKKRKEKKKGKKSKSKKVPFTPKGYASVTPYLIVDDGEAALEFYTRAFGAKVFERMHMGDKIAHAEMRVGDSVVMLADAHPGNGGRSPKSVGGAPVSLMVYVKDCDKVIGRAMENGANLVREVVDQFYGDRSGQVEDPFGHLWTIATHVEDVTPKEMAKRLAALPGP